MNSRRSAPTWSACKIHNQVAILWSRDSLNAIGFMPFTSAGPEWSGAGPTADYASLVQQMHESSTT